MSAPVDPVNHRVCVTDSQVGQTGKEWLVRQSLEEFVKYSFKGCHIAASYVPDALREAVEQTRTFVGERGKPYGFDSLGGRGGDVRDNA